MSVDYPENRRAAMANPSVTAFRAARTPAAIPFAVGLYHLGGGGR
jgi:hypothetical protein